MSNKFLNTYAQKAKALREKIKFHQDESSKVDSQVMAKFHLKQASLTEKALADHQKTRWNEISLFNQKSSRYK
jgi:hypothetical protein